MKRIYKTKSPWTDCYNNKSYDSAWIKNDLCVQADTMSRSQAAAEFFKREEYFKKTYDFTICKECTDCTDCKDCYKIKKYEKDHEL